MAAAFVQGTGPIEGASSLNLTLTLPGAPTPGNLLVLAGDSDLAAVPTLPPGFAVDAAYLTASSDPHTSVLFLASRVVRPGDGASWTAAPSAGTPARRMLLAEYSGIGRPVGYAPATATIPANNGYTLNVSPAGVGIAALAYMSQYDGGHTGGAVWWTGNAPTVMDLEGNPRTFSGLFHRFGLPAALVPLSGQRSWFGYPAFAVALVYPAAGQAAFPKGYW